MEKDNKTNSDNIKTIDEDEILKNVMKEIKKAYGKGAIMKLGDKSNLTIEVISTGSLLLDETIGIVVDIQKDASLKFLVQNHLEKQHCHYMPLLKHKKGEEEVLLLMLNML